MRELALHLLDIAENSVSAHASIIQIFVIEDTNADRLRMIVDDNGNGMDADTVTRITDPFVTSRTTRKVGLGIPLLKAAAEACDGFLNIQSEVGRGTRVSVEFQHSHIDRMPLGNLALTFLTLVVGSPEVQWIFHYIVGDHVFEFDSQVVMDILGDVPLTDPAILAYLSEMMRQGIEDAHQFA